jgi:hypothetical protein
MCLYHAEVVYVCERERDEKGRVCVKATSSEWVTVVLYWMIPSRFMSSTSTRKEVLEAL